MSCGRRNLPVCARSSSGAPAALTCTRPQFPRPLRLRLPWMENTGKQQLRQAVEGYGPSNVVVE
jgi:hypothetical protein